MMEAVAFVRTAADRVCGERVTRGRSTTALPAFTSKSSTEDKP